MATESGFIAAAEALTASPSFGTGRPGGEVAAAEALTASPSFGTGRAIKVLAYAERSFNYVQRVYDSTVAGWCTYIKSTVDPNPLTTETTPNHTNNIVAGTHEVLRKIETGV